MNALNLTKQPPRSPRELLPGLSLLMAARTVDKLRATLPGGTLGEYQITGFSSRLIEALGFPEGRCARRSHERIPTATSPIGSPGIATRPSTRRSTPRSNVRPSENDSATRRFWPDIQPRGA
ncbi:MAG TPA: hypothetical protein VGG51_04665 [Candidatus Cybelea sp.]|jgi:hypothetical protein